MWGTCWNVLSCRYSLWSWLCCMAAGIKSQLAKLRFPVKSHITHFSGSLLLRERVHLSTWCLLDTQKLADGIIVSVAPFIPLEAEPSRVFSNNKQLAAAHVPSVHHHYSVPTLLDDQNRKPCWLKCLLCHVSILMSVPLSHLARMEGCPSVLIPLSSVQWPQIPIILLPRII